MISNGPNIRPHGFSQHDYQADLPAIKSFPS
jgi:hypothetical protein